MSYCEYCRNLPADNVHRIYHDTQYGKEIDDDFELFGRLILEMNQAGLSWDTILKKQNSFREAYSNFNYTLIAKYDSTKIEQLLNNPGIIRHKQKINAAIYNAQNVVKIVEEYGSFKNWLISFGQNSLENWVIIFKKNFKFVGKEIVKEFLMSINLLDGAHEINCYLFK